ncbi:hypothetical protein D9M71_760900 [compost metagenome]
MEAVAAIEIQLAAYALLIEFHHSAPAAGRALVDMKEIQRVHVRQLGEPETRSTRVEIQEVVFLGNRQAHFMNVLGRAELALFPSLEPPLDDPAEHRGIKPGH